MPNENIGLIILAAGASTRMGNPKQLLPYGKTSLIGHAIKEGLNSDCDQVVVVLGAESELIRNTIKETAIFIEHNDSWQEGMGSSLRIGLERMMALQTVTAVMVMVCDQPFVNSKLLNNLISCYRKRNMVGVACSYGNTIGVPALFDAALFPELLKLSGDKGARELLRKYKDQFKLISFPDGTKDIDTPNDYIKLSSKYEDKS